MSTHLRQESVLPADDVAREFGNAEVGADRVFAVGTRVIAAMVLVITGGIGLFLAVSFVQTMANYGLSFFTETRWEPESNHVGIFSVLVGTFTVAVVAIGIAFPLSVLTALYIAEYAPAKLRPLLVSVIDLMAAIPSIIYGLWGFFLIKTPAAGFAHFLHENLGWMPWFKVNTNPDDPLWENQLNYTASAFIAGIAVSMMVMPMACAVMRQVFSQTPPGEREAALALGSTHWGMIRSVVLPFGMGGMIGGTMLALGRALGETIAVLLIVSPAFDLKFRPLEQGTNTIAALIAGRFGEATNEQLAALIGAGFVLFVITLIINTLAAMIVARSRSGAGAEA